MGLCWFPAGPAPSGVPEMKGRHFPWLASSDALRMCSQGVVLLALPVRGPSGLRQEPSRQEEHPQSSMLAPSPAEPLPGSQEAHTLFARTISDDAPRGSWLLALVIKAVSHLKPDRFSRQAIGVARQQQTYFKFSRSSLGEGTHWWQLMGSRLSKEVSP